MSRIRFKILEHERQFRLDKMIGKILKSNEASGG